MRRLAFVLFLALAAPAAAAPPPSVTLPPGLDRVLRDYERAWAAGDTAALARLFAPGGMALPNGRPPARGAEEIRAAYAAGSGSPLSLRALDFAVSGDLAYVIGGFGAAPDRPDFGKFVLVLRRGAGDRWLIVADMDNANAPPPRPGAAPAPRPEHPE